MRRVEKSSSNPYRDGRTCGRTTGRDHGNFFWAHHMWVEVGGPSNWRMSVCFVGGMGNWRRENSFNSRVRIIDYFHILCMWGVVFYNPRVNRIRITSRGRRIDWGDTINQRESSSSSIEFNFPATYHRTSFAIDDLLKQPELRRRRNHKQKLIFGFPSETAPKHFKHHTFINKIL